jgi:predicted transcriptional regulator of viral defense system
MFAFMKFADLIQLTSKLPLFDLATVVQVSGERPANVSTQLHRWAKKGVVVPLRRGMYTLADAYRRAALSPLHIANELYKPSYLSGLGALSYYGLIPERAVVYTSVTTRVTRTFVNRFGEFHYSRIMGRRFWGFSLREIDQCPTWIAEPEKALLDLWYLNPGEWTRDRLVEMRFQNPELVDLQRLLLYAEQWGSPRLLCTARRWVELASHDEQLAERL